MILIDRKSAQLTEGCILVQAVCEQFWQEARREGVIDQQRRELFACVLASGYVEFRLPENVRILVYWLADGPPQNARINVCPENRDLVVQGPAVVVDNDAVDQFAQKCITRGDVQAAIQAAIASELCLVARTLTG